MDEADVNAVRQTALAILYSCVLPPPGAPHREYVFNEDRGSGGWQIAGLIQKILVSLYAIPYDLPQGVKVGEGQSHGTCNEPPIEDPTYMSYFSGHEGNDQGGSGQGRGHGSSGEGTASTGDLAHADLGEPGLNDWADVWGEYLEGGSGQSCAGGNRNGCCGSGLRYQIAAGNGKGESSWDVLLGVTWDVMKTLGNVGVCAAVVIDDGFSA